MIQEPPILRVLIVENPALNPLRHPKSGRKRRFRTANSAVQERRNLRVQNR